MDSGSPKTHLLGLSGSLELGLSGGLVGPSLLEQSLGQGDLLWVSVFSQICAAMSSGVGDDGEGDGDRCSLLWFHLILSFRRLLSLHRPSSTPTPPPAPLPPILARHV
jgi:hypothetical protein